MSNDRGRLHVFVGFCGVVDDVELDACLVEEFSGGLCGVVSFFGDDACDAGGDDELGADVAGFHFAVDGGSVEGDAEACCLDECVLLGVGGADAVFGCCSVFVVDVDEEVSDFVAVGQTGGCADVSGGEDAFVFDDEAAASSAVAGGAFADFFHDAEEVVVPVGSFVESLLELFEVVLELVVEFFDALVVPDGCVCQLGAECEFLSESVFADGFALVVLEELVEVVGVDGGGVPLAGALEADEGVGVEVDEEEAAAFFEFFDFVSVSDAGDDVVFS